jgi:hypothetical protein
MSSQTWILGQESMRFGDTVRAFHWCLTAGCGSLPATSQARLEGVPLHSLHGTEFSTLFRSAS